MLKRSTNTLAKIKESLQASLQNTATFPQYIKAIASVGVTHYKVDLLNHNVKYHLSDGAHHTEDLPPLNHDFKAGVFSKTEVRAAITDIQKQAIGYLAFLNRIVLAGVKSYEVDIDNGKVVYQGETENYTEEFPKLTKT